MLNAVFGDVINILKTTFLGGDLIGLGIVIGAVVIAAMMMERGTQIGSMTLLSLALFALGGFVRGVMKGPIATDGGSVATQTGSRAMGQIDASWAQFSNMQAGTLLAYFIAFMLLILLVFGVKAALNRG